MDPEAEDDFHPDWWAWWGQLDALLDAIPDELVRALRAHINAMPPCPDGEETDR